MSRILP